MADRILLQHKPTVLVVDDSSEIIASVSSILKPSYQVKVAKDGEAALQLISSVQAVDLILLDVVMPGMDGYEVCRRLKSNSSTAELPVIFLTSRSEVEDQQKAFDLGAVDYVSKPIVPAVVTARVRTHVQLKRARDVLENHNAYLAAEVLRRTKEIESIQDVTLVAMGSLAETRDNETGNHIRRTQQYVRLLAEKISRLPRFQNQLTSDTINTISKSAPLHDIGKVGIPDRILLKPGKLTSNEFAVMKTHTTIGRDAILSAERLLPTRRSFLATARDIAWTHHEWWDGKGYPRGLSEESIPLCGRLMAVADVYDALISKRVYKPAMSHGDALNVIRDGAGSHFDPDIANAFLSIGNRVLAVAGKLEDRRAGEQ